MAKTVSFEVTIQNLKSHFFVMKEWLFYYDTDFTTQTIKNKSTPRHVKPLI